MNEIEYVGKLQFKRFTSLEDDFKIWRKEFKEDERRNALKRHGKLNPETVEATYERFPGE